MVTTVPVRADVDDVILAARTTCPVLITGAPDGGLEIARAIAIRGRLGCVRICEPDESGKLLLTEPGDAIAPGVVLVRDVDRLTQDSQTWLCGWLEQTSNRDVHPRIMASSSTCLYERVKQGAFDERLFYRLNVIHLVTSVPRAEARAIPEAVDAAPAPRASMLGEQARP